MVAWIVNARSPRVLFNVHQVSFGVDDGWRDGVFFILWFPLWPARHFVTGKKALYAQAEINPVSEAGLGGKHVSSRFGGKSSCGKHVTSRFGGEWWCEHEETHSKHERTQSKLEKHICHIANFHIVRPKPVSTHREDGQLGWTFVFLTKILSHSVPPGGSHLQDVLGHC